METDISNMELLNFTILEGRVKRKKKGSSQVGKHQGLKKEITTIFFIILSKFDALILILLIDY